MRRSSERPNPAADGGPIFHMIRCAWCWMEVRSDKAIESGASRFCSERCKVEFAKPEDDA
jgi:hypothetical protein